MMRKHDPLELAAGDDGDTPQQTIAQLRRRQVDLEMELEDVRSRCLEIEQENRMLYFSNLALKLRHYETEDDAEYDQTKWLMEQVKKWELLADSAVGHLLIALQTLEEAPTNHRFTQRLFIAVSQHLHAFMERLQMGGYVDPSGSPHWVEETLQRWENRRRYLGARGQDLLWEAVDPDDIMSGKDPYE